MGWGVFFSKLKKISNQISQKISFFLIELSIVLIIIGLLVAGVIGGASLIESAKIRTVMDELMEYKRAIYTFRVAKDRLPGDLNGSGKIGYESGQKYDNTSFGGNYVSSNRNYGVPDLRTAPYVDMYLEKIIDFEPKKTIPKSGILRDSNGGVPNSRSGINFFLIDYVGEVDYSEESLKNSLEGFKFGNYLRWHAIPKNNNYDSKSYYGNKSKYYKILDQKLDDGVYNAGAIRGQCISDKSFTNYDDVKLCRSLYYPIDM